MDLCQIGEIFSRVFLSSAPVDSRLIYVTAAADRGRAGGRAVYLPGTGVRQTANHLIVSIQPITSHKFDQSPAKDFSQSTPTDS